MFQQNVVKGKCKFDSHMRCISMEGNGWSKTYIGCINKYGGRKEYRRSGMTPLSPSYLKGEIKAGKCLVISDPSLFQTQIAELWEELSIIA